jgi:hypothetical protein
MSIEGLSCHCLNTVMRKGEIQSLRWRKVDVQMGDMLLD